MLFKGRKRNSNQGPTPEADRVSPSDVAVETLGKVALPESMSQATFYHEVRKRLNHRSAYNNSFVKQALESGATEEQLPTLVAAAMEAEELPRILPGVQMKGSGEHWMLLDGSIPAELIQVKVFVSNGEFTGSIVQSRQDPFSLRGDNYEGLTITGTGLLPQVPNSSRPVPEYAGESLAAIDAHMPLGYDPQSTQL